MVPLVVLLSDWDVVGRLVGRIFDTTASNSRINTGCCALTEKENLRPIVWLVYRHYMFELHIRHVWEAVSNKPDCPVEPILIGFQSEWDLLEKSTDDFNLYEWPRKSFALYFFAAATFPREDYRELFELNVVYLEDYTTRKFLLRKPGTHHRARFMHNEIYFLKKKFLAERFNLSQDERRPVNAMTKYVALFHGKVFFDFENCNNCPNK